MLLTESTPEVSIIIKRFPKVARHSRPVFMFYATVSCDILIIQCKKIVNILKSNAVGQTAYKVNLPNSAPTSTKNYYPSGTRSTIRRARSGGCVAPKKKGAIENYSLKNGKVCAWGSIVRQNY